MSQWYSEGPPKVEEKKAKSQLHHFSIDGKDDDGLTLNSYVGCAHRCVYCYATYEWTPNFYDTVVVRTNASEVLARELDAWREPSIDPVFLSSATDCYQPMEGKYRLTRRCVESLQKHGISYSILTKSASIVRDLELHARYRDKCVIAWSITTLDEDLKKRLEPGPSMARGMLKALEIMSARGIVTGVNIDPIIPGLTDDLQALSELVRQASRHGATFVNAAYLRLRPDIWNRIQNLLLDLGRRDLVSLFHSLYFERPDRSNGYFKVRSDYENNVLYQVRAKAVAEGVHFGFPSNDRGSPECGSLYLEPKRIQASL